jgi:endonuclease-3 related protein
MECPKNVIQDVFSTLSQHYGEYIWWPDQDPFRVMLGAILVQNTNWKNAEKALNNLGYRATPKHIDSLELEVLAQTIRPSGYYNQKAQKLKALTQWYARYDFDITYVRQSETEVLRKQLLSIKGVGGETADVILVYAIGRPSFVIDAYTRRIFERIGLTLPKSYDGFKALMEQALPLDTRQYARYHGLMVDHGQAFCNPTPKCKDCPLKADCALGKSKQN